MSALILAKYILRQGLVDPDSNESQVDHCHPSRQYAIFGSCSNTNLRSRLSMTLAGIRQFLLPRLMQLALIQQKRLLQLCNHRSRCYSWQRGERTDEKGPKGIIAHCTAKCGGREGAWQQGVHAVKARALRGFHYMLAPHSVIMLQLCSICQEAKKGEKGRESEKLVVWHTNAPPP